MFSKLNVITVKSHILRHALKPGCLNLRTVPQLIGALLPLYSETQFLPHALKSENSRVLLLRACLYKITNFANLF